MSSTDGFNQPIFLPPPEQKKTIKRKGGLTVKIGNGIINRDPQNKSIVMQVGSYP